MPKEKPKRHVTSADVRFRVSDAIYDAQFPTFQNVVVIPLAIWNAMDERDQKSSLEYAEKVNVTLEMTWDVALDLPGV